MKKTLLPGPIAGIFALSVLPAFCATVPAHFAEVTTVPVVASGYVADGNEVDLSLSFAPPTGTTLTVVENTSSGAITGRFSNLAQGQLVKLQHGGALFRFIANYHGGDGNDLELLWADTRVHGWGSNSAGEIAAHRLPYEPLPVPLGTRGALEGKTILSIANGYSHTLALCSDGTLACWGGSQSGVLGSNGAASNTPLPVDQTGVLAGKTPVKIGSGMNHIVVLCSDGTLATWGSYTNSYVPVAVDTSGVLAGKRVVSISCGSLHTLALCSDGTLVAWGSNQLGQLGNGGSSSPSVVPVAVDRSGVLAGKTVVEISAGGRHSLVRCSDGTLAAWGLNTGGELGDGTFTNSNVPVAVNMSGVLAGRTITSISAGGTNYVLGSGYNFALCEDGTVAAWGVNNTGQLGDGTRTSRNLPVDITLSGALATKAVVEVRAGETRGHALCSDGTVAIWGDNVTEITGNEVRDDSLVPLELPFPMAENGSKVRNPGEKGGGDRGLVFVSSPLNNTRLANLEIDFGARTTACVSGPGTWSVAVPHGTASISVIASVQDQDATVRIDGVPVPPGSPTQAIPLSGDMQTVQVMVTAPDGTTTGSQELTVVRSNPVTAVFSSISQVIATYPAYDATGLDISLSLACEVPTGKELKVLDNTGIGFIRGNFNNLAQGQVVSLSHAGATVRLVADYHGGDGNDLVLRWAAERPFMWGSGVPRQGTSTNSVVPVTFSNKGALQGKIIEKISGGSSRSIALCSDGSLVGWGNAAWGTLANIQPSGGSTDVPAAMDPAGALTGKRVVDIESADQHSMALCSDGTVVVWGSSFHGQLGNSGATNQSLVALSVSDKGALAGKKAVAISARAGLSLVLCSDGTLCGWGEELGNTPMVVGEKGALTGKAVHSISQGAYHSLALCTDGTLVSWGYNGLGPNSFSSGGPFGQLGHGGTRGSSLPVLVSRATALAGKTVTQISAGDYNSMVVCSDGTAAAWGQNRLGELGHGNRGNNEFSPVSTDAGDLAGNTVVSISAAYWRAAAYCGDGSVVCWGSGDDVPPAAITTSTLGAGEVFSRLVPGPLDSQIMALAAAPFDNSLLGSLSMSQGTMVSDFLQSKTIYQASVTHGTTEVQITAAPADADGHVTVNGIPATPGVPVPVAVEPGTNTITVTGTAPNGIATTTYQIHLFRSQPFDVSYDSAGIVPVTCPAYDATGLSPGFSLAFAPPAGTDLMVVNNTGQGFVEGRFTNYQQGQLIVWTINGARYRFAVDYYGGDGNDIVLRWAGIKPWSWGSMNLGALGNAATSNALVPAQVNLSTALANKTITALANGNSNTLALCADGSLITWGNGVSGSAAATPKVRAMTGALAGKQVVRIAVGSGQRVALCSDGTLATWASDTDTPVAVEFTGALVGKRVTAIAKGVNHAVVLCSDGTLAAWGYNSNGELGIGTGTPNISNVPLKVVDSGVLRGKTVVDIRAGGSHTLALCSDGTVAGWGSDGSGQLGRGSNGSSYAPVAVKTDGVLAGKFVTAIAASDQHSLALCSDGTVAAWGNGTNGRLGNDSVSSSSVPVEVVRTSGALFGKTVTRITAGADFSMALCSDGTLASWGANSSGQLGGNSTTAARIPATVVATALAAGEAFSLLPVGSQARHVVFGTTLPISSDPRLSSLGITGVPLSPAFAPATASYVLNLATTRANVVITAIPASPFALMNLNGQPLPAGSPGTTVSLVPGPNTFTIDISAQDGSAGQYTVVVNNAPYELWKEQQFPDPADRSNPLVSGANATPANDGLPNLLKYALALGVMDAPAGRLPSAGIQGDRLDLTYRKSKLAGDVTYTVQAQDALDGAWTTVSGPTTTMDKGDHWLVTVQDPVTMTGRPARFMRLRVTKP